MSFDGCNISKFFYIGCNGNSCSFEYIGCNYQIAVIAITAEISALVEMVILV